MAGRPGALSLGCEQRAVSQMNECCSSCPADGWVAARKTPLLHKHHATAHGSPIAPPVVRLESESPGMICVLGANQKGQC